MNSRSAHPLAREGVLFVDKAVGIVSFQLVKMLRRRLGVSKIGHAGTLDPNASGLMVMLVGRNYTRLSQQLSADEKAYRATLLLGTETDTYDCEGKAVATSALCPSVEQVDEALQGFQGWVDQVPPMYSAKKLNGTPLYDLARKGVTVERKAVRVRMDISKLAYSYPELELDIECSKGTYIRSLAHDLGRALGCGAHLSALRRTRSGHFLLDRAIPSEQILNSEFDLERILAEHTRCAHLAMSDSGDSSFEGEWSS